MRDAAIIAIGMSLLLLQGNLYRFTAPLWSLGITPNFVLPLVIFTGIRESAMARGALLAFGLGYATDLFASAPVGLFTFTSVAIWWMAHVTSLRVSAQNVLTQVFLAFIFSLVQTAFVLTLLAIFGTDPQRPLEMFTVALPQALATALFSPLIFKLGHRLYQGAGAPLRSQGGQS